MKQTAVEWLAKELESYGDPQICTITWEDLDSLVNQAKQMEKEQIIKAMSVAFIDGLKTGAFNYESPYECWEQYYNETFNQ